MQGAGGEGAGGSRDALPRMQKVPYLLWNSCLPSTNAVLAARFDICPCHKYASPLSRELIGPIANSAVGCPPWHRHSFSDMNV